MSVPLTVVRAGNAVLGRVAPDVTAGVARRLFFTPRRHTPRAWERAAEDSGERVALAAHLQGLRWGPRGAPPVLLMHGWEGRATQWARFVGPLLAQGKQVVALDGPAHGRSPGRETHMLDFARAILAVGATMGPLDAAIGHSMGGSAIAVALAEGLRARRAALLASPASVEGVVTRFTEFVGLPPPAARRFRRALERTVGAPVERIDIGALGPRLGTVPALILHDPADAEVPFEDGEALAAGWPGARLVRLEGLGHRRLLADDEVVEVVAGFVGGD